MNTLNDKLNAAKTYAAAVEGKDAHAKVWTAGTKVRVYLTIPAGYCGGAGGGKIGYVDFSGRKPEICYSHDSDTFRTASRTALGLPL